jgi:hypothetical protein
MNKFEKLIEYIINDEDQKARELFHDIVVEKSRDIYESIMDEESMGEHVHGEQVKDMVDEISHDESHTMEDEDEEEFGGEEEFSLDHEDDGEDDGEVAGDFPADSGEEAEHEEIEDQVMNIDAKLDELLAKFDEIMGGEESGEQMPAEEPGMDQGGEEDGGEEQGMMEAGNPFAKSGMSGKSGSGKSGSGSAASGKSGSAKMEAAKAGSAVSGKSGASGKSGSGTSAKSGMSGKKGSAEIMREYVDTVGQIYGGQGDATEGDPVGGEGKKVAVNKKPGSVGPGADFGGKHVDFEGAEQAPDGKQIEKPSNEYSKGEGKLIGNVGNTPGGDKKLTANPAGHGAEKNGDSETGEKVGAAKDGKVSVNKKSEIGGKIR